MTEILFLAFSHLGVGFLCLLGGAAVAQRKLGVKPTRVAPIIAGQWFWIARVGEFLVTESRGGDDVCGVYHRTGMRVTVRRSDFLASAVPCEAPPPPPAPNTPWELPEVGRVWAHEVTDKHMVVLSKTKRQMSVYSDRSITFTMPLWQFHDIATPAILQQAIEASS